jgi:cupin 2 domain-containing protein
MEPKNLYNDIPSELSEELFTTIHAARLVRIERIVSQGHASPPGFWYDQEEHEWVIVLRGAAVVQFEASGEAVPLKAGSYVNIPAHTRHRVAFTSLKGQTVWLAVFYSP